MIAVVLFVLQFARHIKKSEGQKTPKVELQISIYGVKILDPKTKVRNLCGFFHAKLVNTCFTNLKVFIILYFLKYYNKSHSTDGKNFLKYHVFLHLGTILPARYLMVLKAHCS